jgi:ribonuclease Z
MECTFLDERVAVPEARAMGHVHLDELVERAELLPGGKVVLSHFSARYDDDEIQRLIAGRVPEDWRAKISLLPPSASR